MTRSSAAMVLVLAASVAPVWGEVSYWRDVRPVLAERCQVCHQGEKAAAGFVVTDAASASRWGKAMLAAVSGAKPRMPKSGVPLTADQVAMLGRWVSEGARVEKGQEEIWWSLRPLPETVERAATIDGFVRAKLKEKGLEPSPEADRRTLIRRLKFDLHGLPPSAAEVAAFAADRRPDAYERLVDELLASPRYGERWARHWFDVIHYGESHGYDKDKPRPNAWPYRDWLIRAFNEDKPYARFVEEQIAGDVLYAKDPQAVAALGFLAAGPWDFVGHQELREGTMDKELTRVLDRDDLVAQTISTFVSQTAHCARCHDHKFDPIPQADYYRLQAVFAGVDRAERPFDEDPELHAKRQAMLARKRTAQAELQPLLDKVEFAESAELTEIDDRIRDGKLLLAHIGTPKTEADAKQQKELQARVAVDTELRKKALAKVVGEETFRQIEAGQARVRAIQAELAALPPPRLVYAATNYFERVGNFRPALQPRPIHLLQRGSVMAKGELMGAGALSCVPKLAPRFEATDEGARRAALARWITAKENVLAWRSAVNRVWHYHFGAGIVDTPNDFGRMGGRPSHPELLDWLAVWFRDEAKGSLKQLHRLIVTSAAYRQSSAPRAEALAMDGDNRLLWRMNRSRLDAESVRDATLEVAGKLDLKMGGEPVRMFWFKDDHSPVYDYERFDPDAPGAYRRSIYRFMVRSVPDPFLERLDCPDASVLTPKRSTTLTAIQALALWNSPFMIRMAEHLAERARGVAEMTELVWQRPPTASERERLEAHAARHGRASVARLLLNSNEFLFVD